MDRVKPTGVHEALQMAGIIHPFRKISPRTPPDANLYLAYGLRRCPWEAADLARAPWRSALRPPLHQARLGNAPPSGVVHGGAARAARVYAARHPGGRQEDHRQRQQYVAGPRAGGRQCIGHPHARAAVSTRLPASVAPDPPRARDRRRRRATRPRLDSRREPARRPVLQPDQCADHGALGDTRSRAIRGSGVLRPARAGAPRDGWSHWPSGAGAVHGSGHHHPGDSRCGAVRVQSCATRRTGTVDPAQLRRPNPFCRARLLAPLPLDAGAATPRLPASGRGHATERPKRSNSSDSRPG